MPLLRNLPTTKRCPIVSRPDRRAGARHRLERTLVVRYITRPSFRAEPAVIRDVSRTGLGLGVIQSQEPGTLVAVQLRAQHAGVSGILTACVRWAARQPDGNWRLGCSLSRPLAEEQLLALL